MTDPSRPNLECPVWIDALTPGDAARAVRVLREDGSVTAPAACRSEHELHRLVQHERPSADIHDPAQIYWVDHPGEWPAG